MSGVDVFLCRMPLFCDLFLIKKEATSILSWPPYITQLDAIVIYPQLPYITQLYATWTAPLLLKHITIKQLYYIYAKKSCTSYNTLLLFIYFAEAVSSRMCRVWERGMVQSLHLYILFCWTYYRKVCSSNVSTVERNERISWEKQIFRDYFHMGKHGE